MMNLRSITTLPCLFVLLAAHSGAQNNYVVGVTPGSVNTVSSTFNLSVLNDLSGGGGPYLMNPLSPLNPAAVAADPNVSSIEADALTISSESSPSAQIQAIASQLADALADSSLVPYYGSLVRSAYLQQPVTNTIQLAAAQQFTSGFGIIAVIDTGVDPSHPALANVLVPGYDFIRNEATIPDEMNDLAPLPAAAIAASTQVAESDKTQGAQVQGSTIVILDGSTVAILDGLSLPAAFGHGTMTAGLIHLVAPSAAIMPLKAFHSDGTANLSDVVRAIYYAVNHGAQVINMSFDIQSKSSQLQDAISYATSHGVICVAASGNEGQMEVTYPAGLQGVFGIASINNSGQRSAFSNYGTRGVFMAAPGEALITTFPGGNYAGVWGTSFSAALVSGTVGSLLGIDPQISFGAVSQALSAGPEVQNEGLGRDQLNVLSSVMSVLENN
jgi:subtilisin family serine protease